jgi:Holliday junction resolvase-like predicted endonuclease
MSHFRGMIAEYMVMLYYLIRGYRVLAHRWKVHKFGEIDLIVCRFNTVVFVEVKSRRLVIAEEIIHLRQLERIGQVAQLFCSKFPKYSNYVARIDFAIVTNFIFPKVVQNAYHFEK